MQIINDQLTITNATDAQIRDAFKEPTPAPVAVQPNVPALTPEQHQALIIEFMKVNLLV